VFCLQMKKDARATLQAPSPTLNGTPHLLSDVTCVRLLHSFLYITAYASNSHVEDLSR
jgi:hypothetical protein